MNQLPDNEYALIAYVIAAAFAFALGSFVVKKGKQWMPGNWSVQHQRQFIWVMALMPYLFGVYALSLAYFDWKKPQEPEKIPCRFDEVVSTYLEEKASLVSNVEKGSDAWIKLQALESFRADDMPCDIKGIRLNEQKQLMNQLKKEYQLR